MAQLERLPTRPRTPPWAAKGIYGEKIWATDGARVPPDHRGILRILVAVGIAGGALLVWD